MSRRILNAHTGACLIADLDSCETFDDLKALIANNLDVSEKRQVLLTPRGKQVKPQHLRNEEDVFVYDRDIIQGNGDAASQLVDQDQVDIQSAASPPSQPGVNEDAQVWLDAAQARAEWAARFEENCRSAVEQGKRLASEIAIIQQGTAIAVDNLKQHLASLQQRRHQAKEWVDSLLAAQSSFDEERNTLETRLRTIPASDKLDRFLKNRPASSRSVSSLLDLLGPIDLNELSTRATKVARSLKNTMDDIGRSFEEVSRRGGDIAENFAQDFVASTGDMLETLDSHCHEQGVLCRKIHEDCVNILRNENGDPIAFSKIFNRHSKNLIPPLLETHADIYDTVAKVVQRKREMVQDAVVYLQKISSAESTIGQISVAFTRLDLSGDDDAALESLDVIYRLPSVYGLVMIEVVRRREWAEKMTNDSTSLAEEMATYRDEEERRRKKWLRSVAAYVSADFNSDVMGVDVSLRSTGEKLPSVTREDAKAYVEALQAVGGFDDALQELTSALRSIDAPSKLQTRRANAFRNGSVSDAPFGHNSLLLRGDDDLIRSLQADKARLEDKLRGSDSRVRRLEDLLHRQSQIQSRPSSRGVGATYSYSGQVTTPTTLDGFSKVPIQPHSPGPYASRRSSLVAQFQEQNPLAERLAHLESELIAERSKVSRLEEIAAKTTDKEKNLHDQIKEATSMKQDLMDNFQAQQNEFEGERRLLEDENRKLKVKLEELEEDFDRIIGSHDNARIGLDERTKTFEQELRNHRERAAEEVERMTTENEALKQERDQLQKDVENIKQDVTDKDNSLKLAESRARDLEEAVQIHDRSRNAHNHSLRVAHSRLASDEAAPTDFDTLIGAVEKLSVKASSHVQDLTQALEKARAENNGQNKQLEARALETAQLKSRFDQEELEVFSLREEVADRKARYASLETELEDQRQDLEGMRTKCMQHEELVRALKERLRAEERKMSDLNAKYSTSKTRHTQAENDLSRLNERVGILEGVRTKQSTQLETRARRAEDVSSKLYSQNQILLKLISQVGYTATRQNGTYVFEKTSRLANGSSTAELSPTVSRSQIGNLDQSKMDDDKPVFLQWSTADNADAEKDLYNQYDEEVSALKIDVVFETLAKRFKEVEHVARKWQREAKNYRERFHRAQFEAQNKIAFRSFKEGDLALFLPTRNQAAKRSWAAFNVSAPHYFLHEQEHHTLTSREWLVARISKVEERVVDLSKGLGSNTDGAATGSTTTPPKDATATNAAGDNDTASSGPSGDDDNPFGLSDGLRWYYLDAAEERLGAAPTTPGLGKSTVASAPEHATGSSVPTSKPDGSARRPGDPATATAASSAAAKVLTKSLDSRRSSTNSKKSTAGAMASPASAQGTFDSGHHGEGAAQAAAERVTSSDRDRLSIDRAASLRRPGSRESAMSARMQLQQHQQQQEQQQAETRHERRRETGSGGWSSLWSMDVALESGKKDGGK